MWYTAADNTSLLTEHFKIFYSSSAVTPLKHLTPVITRVLHQTLDFDLMQNPSRYGAIKENVVPDLTLHSAENTQIIPLITPLNHPILCRQSIPLGKPTTKVVVWIFFFGLIIKFGNFPSQSPSVHLR